jgi:hypothetical protein
MIKCVTIDGVWNGEWIYWTTSYYNALANLHTLQINTTHAMSFSVNCVVNSRSLATASNSGGFSASRAHVLTFRRIFRNWTLVNCQLNYGAISFKHVFTESFSSNERLFCFYYSGIRVRMWNFLAMLQPSQPQHDDILHVGVVGAFSCRQRNVTVWDRAQMGYALKPT